LIFLFLATDIHGLNTDYFSFFLFIRVNPWLNSVPSPLQSKKAG